MKAALVAVIAVVLAASCGETKQQEGSRPPRSTTTTTGTARNDAGAATTTTTARPPKGETVIAAGDIAACGSEGDEKTAALVAGLEGTVLTLGDNAYERGRPEEFAACYEPTWGRFKNRTKPAPGNHDYGTGQAGGYDAYFGVPRWYSFDVGDWHLVALDSNCPQTRGGGCGPGSEQERWLREDLAKSTAACTLAYWHHPRFSSGLHGSSDRMAHLWSVLAEFRADVVLAGHDHTYERFAKVDGIRSFVVGTGGRSLYPFKTIEAGSEFRAATGFGVLVLELFDGHYSWRFVPVPGPGAFTDTGNGTCR